jgi:predicted MPP superfamily phosphohydrolase
LIQLLLLVLMAYGTWIEPFRLQVTHIEVPTTKFADLALPLRIIQISDLHVERLTSRERALPELVTELAPDLIVLTGDFLSTSYTHDARAMADLRILLSQLRGSGGIYAIWGTIEVDSPDELRPILEELEVTVLEDQAVEVTGADGRLWLVGLRCSRDLDSDGATLRALVGGLPADDFVVLLYHTPDVMPEAAALGVDLYLAGHTHGGQWRVPGFGAVVTSSQYGKRYEGGSYQEGSTRLYVSRGLGMEGFGAPRARFFCPPEVVCIDVFAPKGKRPDAACLGGRIGRQAASAAPGGGEML